MAPRSVSVVVNGKALSYEDGPEAPFLGFVAAALGTPYGWGGGSLADAREGWPAGVVTKDSAGVRVYDCTGFVLAAWVNRGMLSLEKLAAVARDGAPDLDETTLQAIREVHRYQDVGSASIGYLCDAVARLQPGDALLYQGHADLYAGRGMVVGAIGGRSDTHGGTPSARVQCRPVGYRASGFLAAIRVKPCLQGTFYDNPDAEAPTWELP